MSILNVNQIQPVGSGQTVTISATNIDTGSATFTGGSVGIGTDNPGASLDVVSNSSAEGIRVRGRSSDSIGSLYFYNHTSATPYGLVQGRSTDFRLGSESNTPVIFIVNGSEVARFNTSGNLAFPSGQGIDFSATADGSGTTTSELLDDYEEGTWTPTLTGFTNAGSSTGRVRNYTRIGNVVTIWFDIFQNNNNMSFSNGATITGLPFSTTIPGGSDDFHTPVVVQYYRYPASTMVNVSAYVETTDTIVFRPASANSDIRHLWGHVTYLTS